MLKPLAVVVVACVVIFGGVAFSENGYMGQNARACRKIRDLMESEYPGPFSIEGCISALENLAITKHAKDQQFACLMNARSVAEMLPCDALR